MGFNADGQNLDFISLLISFVFSLIIAISLIFLLIKINAKFILRIWFLIVSILALGISFTAVLPGIKYASLIGLAVAVPLGILKIYRNSTLIHNITEIFIYPGIAAVFVPILSLTTAIILLVVISIYDMWAVWKSKIMQKMAHFQMNELNILGGFMIPYASKKTREKIKNLKAKYKSRKELEKQAKKSRIKINLAILGGGDVAYSILAAGVVLKTWGLVPSIITVAGAFLALAGLLFFSEKKKFYPAMPFITSGIFLALIVNYLFII
jgi:presenilin-like A22 family membrane protease